MLPNHQKCNSVCNPQNTEIISSLIGEEIMSRTLRERVYPGLSRWTLNAIVHILTGDIQRLF